MVRANYSLWSELVSYPDESRFPRLRDCVEALAQDDPAAGEELEPLGRFCSSHPQGEVEEVFVRTFENNAERALELGWHLHGENYARGVFMARLRGLLREHGIEETVELPDHLSHVLRLLDRAEPDLAGALARGAVLPALARIREGFQDSDNPYLGVLTALERHLRALHPAKEAASDE